MDTIETKETVSAETYWKIRALEGDKEIARLSAALKMANAEAVRIAAYRAAGLNPDIDHKLSDKDCSIVSVQTGP